LFWRLPRGSDRPRQGYRQIGCTFDGIVLSGILAAYLA